MDKKELEAFAREASRHIKTEHDLSDFKKLLSKITLEGELTEHPGYKKHTHSETDNSRNGST